MDERVDCVRSVTDGRYVYIRNFRPDKIYGQHLNYMWQTPTTRVWEQMFKDGKLNAAQSAFWKTKPAEELYDLRVGPRRSEQPRNGRSASKRRSTSSAQRCGRTRLASAMSACCPKAR